MMDRSLLLFALVLPAQSSRPITYRGLVDSLKTRGLTNAELAKIVKARLNRLRCLFITSGTLRCLPK